MRQHAKHVNTKMLSLQTAAPVFSIPSLDPSASEQWKEVFYLCDPSPLALYDACDHPTAAGVIISILWFTKGEIWQNREHKWNLGLFCWIHVVWTPQKRSFSKLRAKRATFTFWVDKSSLKIPKILNLASFSKPEACGQTVLPDMSL